MKTKLRYLLLAGVAAVLGACGQPESGAAPESGAMSADAESSSKETVMERGVSSVDADGNVAPFGMASRKPVPVPEPEGIAEAPAAATAAATSAVYGVHCVACHGADAKGVAGLGLNLVESEFVAGKSQEELIAFLKVGRQPGDPDAVSGVPMPAFSWMSEAELTEVTGYLKSL